MSVEAKKRHRLPPNLDLSEAEKVQYEKWNAAIADLENRIEDGGFAVALSGGGHRATLSTIGALMAIVDRGLAPKVVQVASVSGGSITNAFVAQRAELETLKWGELDDIATELTTTIVCKGVLTKGWISLLLLVPFVLAAAAGYVLDRWIVPYTWLAVLIGIGGALTGLMMSGLIVECLLDRRYFMSAHSSKTAAKWNRAQLGSLSGRLVDHVFCVTDLVLGLPVYASSQHGGFIYRRLQPERRWEPLEFERMEFQTFDASRLSIAKVVRASAAFPGIPPVRFRIPPDLNNALVGELSRTAYLADGGLWNNLGTQVIREDEFFGNYAGWYKGVLSPYGRCPAWKLPILCFNGSAPLRPTLPWAFSIPGIALIKSLLQYMKILNANTVLPRIDTIAKALKRSWKTLDRTQWDSLTLVADLREERAVALEYCFAAQPPGFFPVPGLVDIQDWHALRGAPQWKQLVEKEGKGNVDIPTHLDRIKASDARCLIARGYLNTYLISLLLSPLRDGEIEKLAELPARLDRITGITSRPR